MWARGRYRAIMAAGAFALGAPLSAAAPVPGTLETYRDWTIGCDNRGRFEAVSLLPENGDWADEPFVFGIARDAGPDADVEIFTAQDEKYARASLTFRVDGRKVASLVARGDEAKVQGPQATALALAMARGSVMEVRVNDTVIARPSLAGSAAALRYIDAKQGRAGTVTALVASGPIGRNAVRPAPPAPIIRRAIVPPGPAPAPLWREELATLGRITGCAAEMKDAATGPDLQRLSKGETLILTPCGAGAYNFLSVAVIATGVPGRRAFRLAAFDRKPAWADDIKVPVLVNSMWSPDTSRLDHYAKGRGLGDCGDNQSYVWDGATFRLVEARSMGECRGSWHWIKTWSAQVAG